jgi:hypothetical protein
MGIKSAASHFLDEILKSRCPVFYCLREGLRSLAQQAVGFPFAEDTGLIRGLCSFADASAQQRRGLIEEFKRLCRQFIMMNGWLASDFGGKLREDRLFLCRWFLAPRLMVAGFLTARRCVCVVIFPI